MNTRPLHALLLALTFLCTLLLPAAPAAAQYNFIPGTYSSRDPKAMPWSLTFTQDPNIPTRYIVTGTMGSIITTAVTGVYDSKSDTFSANAIKPSFPPFDKIAIGLMEIDGRNGGQGTFHIKPKIYNSEITLILDAPLTKPDPLDITVTSITPDPIIAGSPMTGRFVCHVAGTNGRPTSVSYILCTGLGPDARHNNGWFTAGYDGDYTIDMSLTPLTAPEGVPTVRLTVITFGFGGSKKFNVFTTPALPIQQPTRALYVDQFNAWTDFFEVQPGQYDNDFLFTYQLVARPGTPDAEDSVTETVTVSREDDPGNSRRVINETVKLRAAPGQPARRQGSNYNLGELPPGNYLITTRIEGPRVAPYTHVYRYYAGGASKDPIKVPDPANLTGSINFIRSNVKPGEWITFEATYSYTTGPKSLDAEEAVELRTPNGNLGKSLTRTFHLERGKPVTRKFRARAPDPGAYAVKFSVRSKLSRPWDGAGSFTVDKPDATATNAGVGIGGGGMIAVPGTYGLVKKEVGKAAPADAGPYGTWSGSQGESSFSASYEGKGGYDSHFSCNCTWSAPPSILKAGDIVELTCSASATSSGKDAGSASVSAGWEVTGAVDIIESTMAFAGVSGSTGKLFPSGNGKCRFKVTGNSPTITISSRHPGMGWGSGGNWTPCIYTYKRDEAPTVAAEPAPAQPADPAPGADGGDETNPGKSLQLTPDEPEDPAKRITAFLDKTEITVRAGETGEIVDVHISNFRGNTSDRVEVKFPQKTDDWASLPGQIVVAMGDGSYDPSLMGRPEHVDGYFFSARRTAPGGTFDIDIVVRQNGAGEVHLTLRVKVIPRPDRGAPPAPNTPPIPGATPPPPPPLPPGPPIITGNPAANPVNFEGDWNTTYGPMQLKQRGLSVEGTYPGGVITGTVSGNTLNFRMDEVTNPVKGFGRFVLSADGNAFDGGWSYSDRLTPPIQPWSGTRSGTPLPPRLQPRPEDPVGHDPAPLPTPPPTGMDLSPGKLATNKWTSEGVGAKTTVEGDKLVMDVPKASEGETTSFSQTPITGDFDITVDFDLVDWKANPEAMLAWTTVISPRPETTEKGMLTIAFVNDGGAVQISISTPAGADQHVLAIPNISKGRLRLTRTGPTWNVSFAGGESGGDWKQVGSVDLKLPPSVHVGFGLERQGALGAKVTLRPHATGTP